MMSPTGRIARTIFSEEHVAFRDSVRRFIAKEITPYHARWEKDGLVPRSAWKAAGEAGLLGIAMPEAYGGLGLDRRFVAGMIEEFGRSGCSGPGFNPSSDIFGEIGRANARTPVTTAHPVCRLLLQQNNLYS